MYAPAEVHGMASKYAISRLVARSISTVNYQANRTTLLDWINEKDNESVAADALLGAMGYSKRLLNVLVEAERVYFEAITDGEIPVEGGVSEEDIAALIDPLDGRVTTLEELVTDIDQEINPPFSYGPASGGYTANGTGGITLPAHASGDTLVAIFHRNDSGTITPPAGWATLRSFNQARMHVFYKLATSGAESGAFTNDGAYFSWTAITLHGDDIEPEILGYGDGVAITYDNTAAADEVGVFYAAAQYSGAAPALPASHTERATGVGGSSSMKLFSRNGDPKVGATLNVGVSLVAVGVKDVG